MSTSNTKYMVFVLLLIVTIVSGCAVRPHPRTPSGLSVEQVLTVLGNQGGIHDLSARARVEASSGGVPQNATLQVRYLAPGNCRIYIYGPFGIDMVRMSVLGDSVVVYVLQPENFYIAVTRESPLLAALVPDMDVGVDLLAALFSDPLPASGERDRYRYTLEPAGDHLMLTITRDNTRRCLYLEGADLRVRMEEYYRGETLTWRKTVTSWETVDGILAPAHMTIERGKSSVELAFSDITVNTGLAEQDLRFTIPASAERLFLKATP
jgi:outer membrane lipoprotein-sorting protein